MQKARHHTVRKHSALTGRRHTVSGSISLPSRGTFHLSLTVLYAIGGKEYSALDGGPPGFMQDYSCPALLGKSDVRRKALNYGTLTLSGQASQPARITLRFVTH